MDTIRTLEPLLKSDMKEIYILLIRTNSVLSSIIHRVTGEEFTHASMGTDSNCREMYSFARRYTRMPLPAGFVKEGIDKGLMGKSPKAPCALYKLTVSEESYADIKEKLTKMYQERQKFHYNLLGTAFCFYGKPRKPKNKFFCSQFIAYILENTGAMQPIKESALYRPNDFSVQPELTLIYKGTLGKLMKLNAG